MFIKAEYDGRLSLTGVVGPKKNGDANGGCGQIDMEFAHRDPAHDDSRYDHPTPPEDITFAPGWDRDKWLDLLDVWRRWHLNDMRAGNPAQEAYLRSNPVKGKLPSDHYNEALNVLTAAGLNPDPETGYRYGTAWLKEDVPEAVIKFLADLPDADRQPAWV